MTGSVVRMMWFRTRRRRQQISNLERSSYMHWEGEVGNAGGLTVGIKMSADPIYEHELRQIKKRERMLQTYHPCRITTFRRAVCAGTELPRRDGTRLPIRQPTQSRRK
jgi:hypothetical protein